MVIVEEKQWISILQSGTKSKVNLWLTNTFSFITSVYKLKPILEMVWTMIAMGQLMRRELTEKTMMKISWWMKMLGRYKKDRAVVTS